jgi:transcriptional regulator with XRE-family HTH domain
MTTKKTKSNPSLEKAILEGDLGAYLRIARESAGFSQGEVARALKMAQFQSVSQWERNASGSVPVKTLLKLVEIYDLSIHEMYDVLLRFQSKRLEEKLEQKVFGKVKKGRSA